MSEKYPKYSQETLQLVKLPATAKDNNAVRLVIVS